MAIASDYVHLYTMDNIDGATLIDETGNQNGTISGAPAITKASIKNGLDFQGLNENYVDLGTDLAFISKTGVFTLSVYIKLNSRVGFDYVMGSTPSATADKGFALIINDNGNIRFAITRGISQSPTINAVYTGLVLQSDVEYSIQIIGDGSNVTFYVNGENVYTEAFTNGFHSSEPTRNVYVGHANYTTANGYGKFDGVIDQLVIYDRTLNHAEIKQLAEEALRYSYTIPDDHLIRYSMDSIIGSTLYDDSNSSPATIFGATEVSGVSGKALNFLTSADYVLMPSRYDFIHQTAIFSICAWVSIAEPDLDSSVSIVSNSQTSNNHGFTLIYENRGGVGDHEFRFLLYVGVANQFAIDIRTPDLSISDDKFHHVCVTGDGSTISVYIDGALTVAESLIQSLSTGVATDFVGISVPGRADKMKIDEFKLFQRTLNEIEVRSMYIKEKLSLDLIAHYTMSKINTGLLFDELNNFNIDLSTTNITRNNLAPAYFSECIDFSGTAGAGTSNILTVPITPSADLGDNFTISCWVNPDSAINYRGVFGDHYNDSNPALPTGVLGFQFWDNQWVAGWFSSGVGNYVQLLESDIPTGQWSNVAMVCENGTDLYVYVNGVEKARQVGAQIIHNDDFYIGAAYLPDSSANPRNFDGKIEQFRIHSRSLQPEEVESLYYEVLINRFIRGTLDSTLAVTKWFARAYRIDNGQMTSESAVVAGLYSLAFTSDNFVPHSVTTIPHQGEPWTPGDVINVNDLRYPNDLVVANFYYKANTLGSTGFLEPVWPTTPGHTVIDGDITWECVEEIVQPITHSPLIPE